MLDPSRRRKARFRSARNGTHLASHRSRRASGSLSRTSPCGARETVAIEDVARQRELDDATLGGREGVARARLAGRARRADRRVRRVDRRPCRCIGASRGSGCTTRSRWPKPSRARSGSRCTSRGSCEENERRLAQQAALLKAAQTLASELELAAVLERLVERGGGTAAARRGRLLPLRRRARRAALRGRPRPAGGARRLRVSGRPGRRRRGDAQRASRRPDGFGDPRGRTTTTTLRSPAVWSRRCCGRAESRAYSVSAPSTSAGVHRARTPTSSRRSRASRRSRCGTPRLSTLDPAGARAARLLPASPQCSASRCRSPATLEAVAQAATEALGGTFAAVLMPRRGELELAASAGLPQQLRGGARGRAARVGATACRRRGARDASLASPAARGDDRFEPRGGTSRPSAGYRRAARGAGREPARGALGARARLLRGRAPRSPTTTSSSRASSPTQRAARSSAASCYEAERTRACARRSSSRAPAACSRPSSIPAAVLEEVVQQAPALLGADACAVRHARGRRARRQRGCGQGRGGSRRDAYAGDGLALGRRRSSRARRSRSRMRRRRRALADADPILGGRLPRVPRRAARRPGRRARTACSPSTPAGRARGGRRRSRRCTRSPATRRPRSRTPSSTHASSIEKERSSRSSRTSPTGSSPSTATARSSSGTRPPRRSPASPQAEAIGRTTVRGAPARARRPRTRRPRATRLVPIQRGGEEVWLSRDARPSCAIRSAPSRAASSRSATSPPTGMVEEMKSEFVAAVSHELRTPLTSIYGFAETLLRQDILFGEEERRTFLGYIASESERLTEIVDPLLNVARLDAGDLQVELGRIDVGSVVSEVVGDGRGERRDERPPLRGRPARRAARGRGRSPTRCGRSSTSSSRTRSGTRPHGGTVTVGARRNADRVEVRVVDEGMGIPAAERERIFRKFYRAESAARDGAAGTGLGLFIARELVTAMGGRIWVDSTEGRGLELRVRAARPRASRRSAGYGYSGGDRGIDPEHDQSSRNRRRGADPAALPGQPRGGGHGRDRGARTGRPGSSKARDETPDVILLDVMMPGLDGWRVAEQLLEDERTRRDPDHLPDRARRVPRSRARPRHRRRRLRHEAVQSARARAARAGSARSDRSRRARRAARARRSVRAPRAHGIRVAQRGPLPSEAPALLLHGA